MSMAEWYGEQIEGAGARMPEYVPSTEDIRADWVWEQTGKDVPYTDAEATFNAWLEEVKREAAEKAWDEGAEEQYYMSEKVFFSRLNPYREVKVRANLEEGIRQSAAGEVESLGSFEQYADEEAP